MSAAEWYGGPPAAEPSRRRRWPIVAVAVAGVVVAAVIALVLVDGGRYDPFAPHRGTATVVWRGSDGATTAAFHGTIDGVAVSGTSSLDPEAVQSFTSGSSAAAGQPVAIYRWTGQFDGKRFNLVVSLLPAPSGSSKTLFGFTGFGVTGTYGTDPVHVSTHLSPGSTSSAMPFSGTVGHYRVSGTVAQPTGSGGTRSTTVSFTVS